MHIKKNKNIYIFFLLKKFFPPKVSILVIYWLIYWFQIKLHNTEYYLIVAKV